MPRSEEKELNLVLLSRALCNHDPFTAYTLLAERYSPPVAGLALLKLIETIPDWPKSNLKPNIDTSECLTRRELQVLRCADRGITLLETAREMVVSIETIKTHRRNIFFKLTVMTIAEAVYRARDLGLIA